MLAPPWRLKGKTLLYKYTLNPEHFKRPQNARHPFWAGYPHVLDFSRVLDFDMFIQYRRSGASGLSFLHECALQDLPYQQLSAWSAIFFVGFF